MGELMKLWFIGLYALAIACIIVAAIVIGVIGFVWVIANAPYGLLVAAGVVILPLLVGWATTQL